MARRAEAGAPDMHYAKLTAWDAVAGGVLDREEIEGARRDLPEAVFAELYLAEPSDDGGNPFGLAHIAACVGVLSLAAPVCWGIDLAKSQDWSVAIALDDERRVCRFERWQGPWQETKRRIRQLVGTLPALVDSSGVGDPIVEDLQRPWADVEDVPDPIAPLIAELEAESGNFTGFKFSATSKQQLMEGLTLTIQDRAIEFPDGVIRQELESFEYEYTRTGVHYSAPPGYWDDCVCALALADLQFRHLPAPLIWIS